MSVEKKMLVGEFPLPKTDMSGMSRIPCNATPKNGRGEKKPPRAYREEKKIEIFFLSVGEKKCRLEKKCQWSRMTGVNLRPRTVIPNGSIRRCHAEGPGFDSRGSQVRIPQGPVFQLKK